VIDIWPVSYDILEYPTGYRTRECVSLITDYLTISSSTEIRNCLVAVTDIQRLRWQNWE